MEAMRALKRRLSGVVYRQLLTDAVTPIGTSSPAFKAAAVRNIRRCAVTVERREPLAEPDLCLVHLGTNSGTR